MAGENNDFEIITIVTSNKETNAGRQNERIKQRV